MQVFFQWAQKRDHPKSIEVLAPDTLDSILQHFFTEINKKDGKDYEPSSSAAMQNSVDRYLRESNYEYSILNSGLLKGSRDVLEGKATLLHEKGLGKEKQTKKYLNKERRRNTVGIRSAR